MFSFNSRCLLLLWCVVCAPLAWGQLWVMPDWRGGVGGPESALESVYGDRLGRILAGHIEANGGMAAYREVVSLVAEGRVESGEARMPFLLMKHAPDYLMLVLPMEGGQVFARVYDGRQGWEGTAERAVPMTPEAQRLFVGDAPIFGKLFRTIVARQPVEFLREEVLAGEPCYWVRVPDEDPLQVMEFALSQGDFRERRIVSFALRGERQVRMELALWDSRPVPPLHVPFRVESRVDGDLESVTVLERVEVNPPTFPALFKVGPGSPPPSP